MPRASIVIRAPWGRVAELYRDYRGWPRLFSATIRSVRLVRSEGARTELEIDHQEGKVPNVMTMVGPDRVDRYEGNFVNRFEAVPERTRYTVVADIRLTGVRRLLGPMLGRYIRRSGTF